MGSDNVAESHPASAGRPSDSGEGTMTFLRQGEPSGDPVNPNPSEPGLPLGTPGSKAPKPHRRPKNKCGAEIKRRKKARMEALALASTSKSGISPMLRPEKAETASTDPSFKPPSSKIAPKDHQARAPARRRDVPSKGKKRIRSDGSVPSPSNVVKRRPHQTENKRAYSEVATAHLRVAIIDSTDPLGKMSKERADLVKAKLLGAVDDFLFAEPPATVPTPDFGGCSHRFDIFYITCCDSATLEWLRKTIESFPPLWEGAKLKVVRESELPRLRKATLWIPDCRDEADLVMRRLRLHNRWANIHTWTQFMVKDDQPGGKLLILGVPETEIELLKARNGRLSYQLSHLYLKIHNPESSRFQDKNEMGPAGSSTAAAQSAPSALGAAVGTTVQAPSTSGLLNILPPSSMDPAQGDSMEAMEEDLLRSPSSSGEL